MLSGVSVTCFTASYAVALILEATRLAFRSGIRGAVLLGFGGAGLFAHTIYLVNRAAQSPGSPLSSQQDWYLVVAWVLAASYLYLSWQHKKTALGLFVLPLVLAIVVLAAFVADPTPFPAGTGSQIWATIHGAAILLAAVTVLAGFVFGLMYLFHAYLLKRKFPVQWGLRLPSLEWLARNTGQAVVVSAPLMGLGVVSGFVLNRINGSDRLPWSDPLTLATLLMFAWLAIAAGTSVFYRPARQGRKTAYLTVASFGFLVLALGVGLFAGTRHQGSRQEDTRTPGSAIELRESVRGVVKSRKLGQAPIVLIATSSLFGAGQAPIILYAGTF